MEITNFVSYNYNICFSLFSQIYLQYIYIIIGILPILALKFHYFIYNESFFWKHRLALIAALIYTSPMFKAVFPGSFDPATLGHVNIIERASSLIDELVVIIAENRLKKYFFTAEERLEMMKELIKPWKNVSVRIWDSLIVDYMKQEDIRLLIRGVRGMEDFSYEFELSMMNKGLHPHIETLFMTTDPRYFVIRSSSIRELASFHGDISGMVPPIVEEALKKKFS